MPGNISRATAQLDMEHAKVVKLQHLKNASSERNFHKF